MTETSQEPPAPPPGPPGVDTDHLRDYAELRRSVTDRRIAGVCGGLGRHLNIDPTVLRVLFVVLCLFGGAGLVLYAAVWLLVPEEGHDAAAVHTSPSTRNALLFGAAVVALVLLVGRSWAGFWFPWPLILIAVLVVVLLANHGRSGGAAPVSPEYAERHPQAGPYSEQQVAYTQAGPMPYVPAVPRRRGPILFGATLALVALGCGVLGLFDAAGASVVPAAYPALALAITGAMLVLGSFFGRPGGLVALGLVTAVALAVTSVLPAGGSFRSRSVSYAPASAATVMQDYFTPVGRTTLDLSRVADPAALDGRDIEMHGRAGTITVVLPPGLTAQVDAQVQAGDVRVGHTDHSGTNVHVRRAIGSGASTVRLDLGLFVGDIEVRQEQ